MLTDLRYVLRNLRNAPWFTATVVATLGLGIAVAAAVFSLANWLALRPLPGVTGQNRLAIVDFQGAIVSYPNLQDLRRRMGDFLGLAGQGAAAPMVAQIDGGSPRLVAGTIVSANYFSVLGVAMAKGRSFTPDEEAAGAGGLVAVIGHRMWVTQFGSDPGIVGRSIIANGLRATVVGVTPPGFHGTELLSDVDIWVPGSALWAIAHMSGRGDKSGAGRSVVEDRTAGIFTQLVARLAPGVTLQQARAQLGVAVQALTALYPQENARWKRTPPAMYPADGVPVEARAYVRRVLTLLMGAAGLVLLLAAANVANLYLSRGVTRRGIIAMRRALGGSRGRVLQSQVLESLLLAALAGAAGLVLCLWLAPLFRGMTLPGGNPWLGDTGIAEVRLDWRGIVFAELVALLTGCSVGLLSGLVSTRGDPIECLKASGATGSVGRGRLRGALVAGQLAVSVTLLIVGLLLARTVRNLRQTPVGFDAARVTAFGIWPPFSGYTREESRALLRDVVPRVRGIPGVEDAAFSVMPPFEGSIGDAVRRPGATSPNEAVPAVSAWIGARYFRTMGIPLLAGREFDEGEGLVPPRHAEEVAVVSASQARALFGTVNVVGRLVQNENPGWVYRIIGVAQDTRWQGLRAGETAAPFYQPPFSVADGGIMLVRSSLAQSELRPAVARVVAALAPSVPLFDVERLSDKVDRSIAEPRLLAKALSAFTALAIVLAAIGLYAVVAFSVAERTREMAIRIALGARSAQVIMMVLRQGLALGGIGLGIGGAGALGLSRIIASQLYGVSPFHLATYGLAAVLLFALVVAASAAPARRATRVDPIEALRYE